MKSLGPIITPRIWIPLLHIESLKNNLSTFLTRNMCGSHSLNLSHAAEDMYLSQAKMSI